MTDMKMYAVYDSKAEVHSAPFVVRTKGEAIRSFQEAANNKESHIGKYPEDYALFEIAEWNDENGVVTPHKAPIHIGGAREFLKQPN